MAVSITERNQDRAHNTETKSDPQFGAFIQVFVKEGNNIGCLSYPLPHGITTEQAQLMLNSVLFPNESPATSDSYRSQSGDLMFTARKGHLHPEFLERFLNVPGNTLGVDQSQRKVELTKSVLNEFLDGIAGKSQSAQMSTGKNIFAFSYEVDTDGGVYGLGLNGQKIRLSGLAMEGYEEHKALLFALEEKLIRTENIVILNFDKGKTVSQCCAHFFRDKQLSGSTQNNLLFYFGATELIGKICEDCGYKVNEQGHCRCKKD